MLDVDLIFTGNQWENEEIYVKSVFYFISISERNSWLSTSHYNPAYG